MLVEKVWVISFPLFSVPSMLNIRIGRFNL